jgi:hypothetical protein
MEPVSEFTPCFLRVVARFSAHADPNTLRERQIFGHIIIITSPSMYVYDVLEMQKE